MKPLPEAWTTGPDRLFTAPAGSVRARPWWQVVSPATGTVQRQDGVRVVLEYGGGWGVHGDLFVTYASCKAAMAGIDRKSPLLFPGLRVGQVWALATPDGAIHGAPFLIETGPDGLPAKGPAPLDRRDHFHPYLLHDPLRPDLAPWSAPDVD